MATGQLRVEVRTAREAIPIVGARIEYFVGSSQVAFRVTDASGIAPAVEFDTPERALSLDADYTGTPYSVCSIRITANRYRSVRIGGIQLLADETAIQPVEMEPVIITSPVNERTPAVYDIPLHQLAAKEPHQAAEVGQPRILDRVVVPEYITVHLGRPDASADNVTVTFPYYIKNVCCSEIYATWPENAIRANVYCQVSLALNRVYTEWYRSRGYNFDITNSTQFDQYYVRGRNIFENISQLVDELFNKYLRREGSAEPYYAEYCNGTTATCEGLKQWGTVQLAQQGYSPLSIVRYYYGSDISVQTAERISGTISSYPGTALRPGSSGSAVRTVQTQLTRIRRNYPLIPSPGSIDGVYGSATQAAVRQFQKIFSLSADGVVGSATWYKLSYIYAAVLRLAELSSEGVPLVPSASPTDVLRRGDRGERVSLAQFMLTLAAQFYQELSPIEIDGIFGQATHEAVVEFQNLRGLVADGVIGAETWNQLYNTYYSVFDSLVSPSVPYPGTLLQNGSSGNSVAIIQRMLNVISVFFPSIPRLNIDGRYGPATAGAVRAFQELFGLRIDGIVGPDSWSRIVRTYDNLVI